MAERISRAVLTLMLVMLGFAFFYVLFSNINNAGYGQAYKVAVLEIAPESPLQEAAMATSAAPSSRTSYIFAGSRIAELKDNRINYFQDDHLGTESIITDESGKKVSAFTNYPFGETLVDSTNDYKYTGKELDDTGLYYYGARYYAPGTGRFTQVDPVLRIDANYVYVRNNPLILNDPSGKLEGGGTRMVEGPGDSSYTQFDYVYSNKPWWHPEHSLEFVSNACAGICNAGLYTLSIPDQGLAKAGFSVDERKIMGVFGFQYYREIQYAIEYSSALANLKWNGLASKLRSIFAGGESPIFGLSSAKMEQFQNVLANGAERVGLSGSRFIVQGSRGGAVGAKIPSAQSDMDLLIVNDDVFSTAINFIKTKTNLKISPSDIRRWERRGYIPSRFSTGPKALRELRDHLTKIAGTPVRIMFARSDAEVVQRGGVELVIAH